ncbi:cobalamin-independent methionine synthase II family protein [Streptomyces albidus (ex Kaewkla and Franco 2022)]|uniref:cobalamin-independent methionine synthase II family protein n=1 Tax=Streptomyces albidus (ex Kaewkla and Franco 2022) TaxID=722709 RepID=UPI001B3573A8|nr:cobalamin-independent methionine synthase II family protein [Streptomyces albidus (ex Kaewkla and Franco 2022)]
MKRSTDTILTTHTGSLPRPPELTRVLEKRDRGLDVEEELAQQTRTATAAIVKQQLQAGIAVVNDGEASKIGYSTYVKDRLEGFGGEGGSPAPSPDLEEFPEYVRSVSQPQAAATPACIGPVAYGDLDPVRSDIANLREATADTDCADAFMTAASPGVISIFLENQHYPSHEEYIWALAEAMKTEYDAIHRGGFVLQLDCPDLAAARHRFGEDLGEFRRRISLHIEALNHATRDVPSDDMRLHLCWGNYEGPHTRDVPLSDIVDLIMRARPAAISFEAANPRHAHEWTVFEEVEVPQDKVLIPGVLDSTTNYVEHPELVGQRIARYANLVGRENVLAGSDCGFATFAARPTVHPTVVWAKLRALADGARLASERL